MDFQTCVWINGPFSFITIVVNVFFIFCMIRPIQGEKIKQPLRLLLGTLVSCTIIYEVSVVLELFVQKDLWVQITSYLAFILTLSTSMTSSVWLNFFYYTQIVPAKRALAIWIKSNIKLIIYYIWLFEKILCVFNIGALFGYKLVVTYNNMSSNSTVTANEFISAISQLRMTVYFVSAIIIKLHFLFCLCVMAMSNFSTVVYLCKHMRRMVANGQPLSCPQFRSQMRVTITGVLQGVIYLFCAMWSMHKFIDEGVLSETYSNYTYSHFTVINLYMMGTTLNLGAGQAVFRQRLADIWLRAVHWCSMRKSEQRA